MKVVWIAALALFGCGGTKLDGSVDGESFTINSSATQSPNGELVFVLSSQGDVCSDLSSTTGEPGSSNLAITLRSTTDGTDMVPVTTGTYVVGATTGLIAAGEFEKFDDDCSAPKIEEITAGSVAVTSFGTDPPELDGKLELSLGTDKLSGEFSSSPCGPFTGLRCPIIPPTPTD